MAVGSTRAASPLESLDNERALVAGRPLERVGEHGDRCVRELGEERRLPVAEHAGLEQPVGAGVRNRIGNALDEVGSWRSELPQRAEVGIGPVGVLAAVADRDRAELRARAVRCVQERGLRAELVGHVGGEVAVEGEQLGRRL